MSEEQRIVVVDASLVLKWIIYETDSPLAQALLTAWATQSFLILAPDLLIYEITNSVYKKVRRDEITLDEALHALNTLMLTSLIFETVTDEKLSLKALDFATHYKLPAAYDAHYLALAAREQCEFWTADERLYNAVKDQFAWVRFMAQDRPASSTA